MQESTAVPLRRALALFGGLVVSVLGGLTASALFGHPWGDILGQVIFLTCWITAFMFALEGRLPKNLGIGLLNMVINIAAWEYFWWNRGEPLAIAVIIVVVLANAALLLWLRPWRRTPMPVEVTHPARS